MTKLGSLLGRRPTLVLARSEGESETKPAAETSEARDIASPASSSEASPVDQPASPLPHPNILELDQELFFPIVNQLGEENEAVRNLLIDAEHKIGELETIKRSIGRLVDPVSKTLRAFEEAKSETLAMQGALNNTRLSQAKLREDLTASEKRAERLDAECARLRDIVTTSQQSVSALETTRKEQAIELASRRSQVAELQRQLQQQASELQITRAENQRADDKINTAEQRMLAFESEASAAQQKFLLSDKERVAVQAMLDKALNDAAQLSRRILESDKGLTAAQARIRQLDQSLDEVQTERDQLAASLDETSEALRSAGVAHNAKIEAMQARLSISDTLLGEARKALASRAEELRAHERRSAEAMQTRDAIETKFGHAERLLAEREDQITELEQERDSAVERARTLEQALRTRDSMNGRAQETIDSQGHLIQLLEGQLRAAREGTELQMEELRAQLQREQLERQMAEGALEAGRKDIARLLRELSAVQNGGTISQEAVDAALMRFRNAA